VHRSMHGYAGNVNALNQVVVRGRALLATASADRMVRLWDPSHRVQQTSQSIRGGDVRHNGAVNAILAVNPANGAHRTLLTASVDGSLRTWDTSNGHQLKVDYLTTVGITAVCLLEQGSATFVAAASYAGVVQVRELMSDRPRQSFATN